jgi:hypothetical protein
MSVAKNEASQAPEGRGARPELVGGPALATGPAYMMAELGRACLPTAACGNRVYLPVPTYVGFGSKADVGDPSSVRPLLIQKQTSIGPLASSLICRQARAHVRALVKLLPDWECLGGLVAIYREQRPTLSHWRSTATGNGVRSRRPCCRCDASQRTPQTDKHAATPQRQQNH